MLFCEEIERGNLIILYTILDACLPPFLILLFHNKQDAIVSANKKLLSFQSYSTNISLNNMILFVMNIILFEST